MNEKRTQITHLMLERLVNIHKKIKSGSYPNTKQLADEFNEGKGIATISRDIEFLRDRFNAPIEYDYQHRGYYYSEDFDLPINSISKENLQTLFAAKQLLSHFKDTPIYNDLNNVLDIFSDTKSIGNLNLLDRIALPPMPHSIINENVWHVVMNSIQNNSIIEFEYNGRWKTETTHRKVHPYQLVLDDGKYFLYGYSEERKALRLFSLSRIKNPIETDESFILPEHFDFESQCGGGKFGSFSSDKKEHYKIEFYENSRQMIKCCIWAEDQVLYDDENQDCTTIEFNSTQYLKIEEWILSQGCFAKPLEPEWLVKDWKDHIVRMQQLLN